MSVIPPPAPPPAPMPNGPRSEYDFILNPGGAPQKKTFGGGSSVQRLALVVGGVVLLIIVASLLFGTVFKSKGNAITELTDLAQQQNEIARVAAIGVEKAESSATRNFAHTTQLTMSSSQQDTLALLEKGGHKLGVKVLALKTNPATDQSLNNAAANSTFDNTFKKIISDELSAYRKSLQGYYATATSSNERALLQDSFTSVTLLLGDKQTF